MKTLENFIALIGHFRGMSQEILSKVSNEARTFNLAYVFQDIRTFRPVSYPDLNSCDELIKKNPLKRRRGDTGMFNPLLASIIS